MLKVHIKPPNEQCPYFIPFPPHHHSSASFVHYVDPGDSRTNPLYLLAPLPPPRPPCAVPASQFPNYLSPPPPPLFSAPGGNPCHPLLSIPFPLAPDKRSFVPRDFFLDPTAYAISLLNQW